MRVCDRDGQSTYRFLKNLTDDSEYDLCMDCFQEFIEWLGGSEERPESVVDLLNDARNRIRNLSEEVHDLRNKKIEEPKKGLLARLLSR